MEIKRKNCRKASGKRLICPLLAFVLTLGLVVAMPGLNGEAEAINFEQDCSVTVSPVHPENEMADDLDTANVVIDLYKVAKAVQVSGYDTYDFEFVKGYEKLEEIYRNNPNNADWREMAQSAARYAVENDTPVENGKGVPAKSSIANLDCGLYLLIARGSDIPAEAYTTEVRQEDGSTNIATIAHSDVYEYTFAPELISLPSKQIENADGDIDNTTAGNGEWQYAMNVNMKPLQNPRYGSLEIVKTLQSYNYNEGTAERQPAEFVFQVEAELNGQNVRSTVVSLSFTEAGQKSAIVDKIPVGASVTVTEVYSGSSYEIVSSDEQRPDDLISADRILRVEFENAYNNTNHGGGSATNHFEYQYNEESGQWEWGWTKVPDNSTNSTSGE